MLTYPGLPGPLICDFLSREKSRETYAEGTEFQIGKIEMVGNTGTYVDSPSIASQTETIYRTFRSRASLISTASSSMPPSGLGARSIRATLAVSISPERQSWSEPVGILIGERISISADIRS